MHIPTLTHSPVTLATIIRSNEVFDPEVDYEDTGKVPTMVAHESTRRLLSSALQDYISSCEASIKGLVSVAADLRSGKQVALYADGEAGAAAAETMAQRMEGNIERACDILDLFDEGTFALLFR